MRMKNWHRSWAKLVLRCWVRLDYLPGRGYKLGKNYGRSPALLANLIALGVAYYQIQGAFYIGAMIILSLALPIIYLVLAIAKSENS